MRHLLALHPNHVRAIWHVSVFLPCQTNLGEPAVKLRFRRMAGEEGAGLLVGSLHCETTPRAPFGLRIKTSLVQTVVLDVEKKSISDPSETRPVGTGISLGKGLDILTTPTLVISGLSWKYQHASMQSDIPSLWTPTDGAVTID